MTGLAALVPLPVAVPLLAAGVKFALGPRMQVLQRWLAVATLAVVLAVAATLLYATDRYGPQVVRVGGWPAPLGIVLVADRLSALLLVVSAAVTLCVLVYATGQGMADDDRAGPLAVFHPTFIILMAGVADAFLAGDLFNLYVGFEILLSASYVLLTLGGTPARIRAGTTYIVVGLVSSVIFLIALGLSYAATGTLNMADLAVRLAGLPPSVRLVLQLTLLLAFGVKAAVFPLSAWLPDSYPTAPAPVTAVFAGLLTKVGVYAMIRTETLLFPGRRAAGLLLVVAALTMIIGILGAIAQTDLKRMLSFTLVSHIGYLVFGVGLMSVTGLGAAIFYVAHHITVQTTLFLVAALVERRGGTADLDRMGGLARRAPLLAVLFFVPAMSLAGIPPLSGFLGKLGLLRAGVAAGTPLAYALVATGLVTSLLTLYAVARVWNRAFWRVPPEDAVARPGTVLESARAAMSGTRIVVPEVLPRRMVGATVALVLLGLAFTAFAGPLVRYTDRAAAELLRRGPYVGAVLGSRS